MIHDYEIVCFCEAAHRDKVNAALAERGLFYGMTWPLPNVSVEPGEERALPVTHYAQHRPGDVALRDAYEVAEREIPNLVVRWRSVREGVSAEQAVADMFDKLDSPHG